MAEDSHRAQGFDRRSFLRGGVLLGAGAATLAVASAVMEGTARAATPVLQPNWYWCKNCTQLFYNASNTPNAGACPAIGDGPHDNTGSYDYDVYHDAPGYSNSQSPWNYCYACKEIYWGPDWGANVCLADYVGGYPIAHKVGTTVYYLAKGNPGGWQGGWNWCDLCQGLFHGNGAATGVCAGNSVYDINNKPQTKGKHHPGNGSGTITNYYLKFG